MKVKVILSAIALLCVGFVAQAQEVKIGYTNVEFIMDLMPEMEQIGADIQDYQTQLQTNIQTKAQDFQRQVQSYQQAAGTMTEQARAAKEQELTKLQQDLQKYEQDAQVSYQRKLQELLDPVQTKVINAINAVAAENNYTHVFAETAGQAPILLYTKEEDKFTELVLAKLGVEMPKAPATLDSTRPRMQE
ncbi:MAG TPA: hypothetical protein DEQ87_03895 [Algoriphagus sp.]|jgi:outer membrane protein|uniref:OmpH family outer membrane protein n=1 Tax=unclassified Algoriphagus TaxID=2641541 RepID=UPI000C42D455|nr:MULTISPECIES: OmpH family outer membrane protein [unclassified Algoriphagus]MAL12365.1 hypothetical protein [Algoriphagus sp.]QYH40218.1 OmpH family outer membrane protein [Algoriphagus sp. NBT04N3]HAH36385.1 hypothetical protein [Algoriphagus sp.]HAS59314.1 hypothetical protein [Algoriphagus sp.]HAZ24484.1 hypothetical protein [Algoriphagus sp.]|tara:strand:+ start:14515 stop:15084 length:570 start_codon:yes stop_codon:yes gene_type:complete